jgi:secreted PhoX family phosphatase
MAVEDTALDLTRRRFVQGSAAVGGGLMIGGPLSALAARTAEAAQRRRAVGYGPLVPARDEDTGIVHLELPRGFRYRVISRQGQPMSDGNPTPGIFDGTGSFPGRGGQTILIRNHENRSRPGEIPVVVPNSDRYDPDPNVKGGNTKLVVDRNRRVVQSFAVLGGTHTNCAGGEMPWGSWITCEEVFNYGSTGSALGGGVPHGYCFEVPADASGPVNAIPIADAGRFVHEAVAWLGGVLYETEDRGDAAFYRFLPSREPREFGDLATFGGTLQALVVRNRPNFDADTANPGESYPVEWVTIDEPNPVTEANGQSTRGQAQAKGGAIFSRTEGIWATDRRIYFDCTSGGEAGLGQVWEYTPRGRDGGNLELVYESTSAEDLEAPDNLVVVPATGDLFLQEDGGGDNYVRGVTQRGFIYDFARTVLNDSEFCGGCFSPDGRTFFVNQQGGREGDPLNPAPEVAGVTYAIWGPFGETDEREERPGGGRGRGVELDDDDRRREAVGRGRDRGAGLE